MVTLDHSTFNCKSKMQMRAMYKIQTKIYKHLVTHCLAGLQLVKLYFLKKYLSQVLAISEIESVSNSSNAFPGKYFVQ